jgi:probable rRNA maturation factor
MRTGGTVYIVNRRRACALNSALVRKLSRAVLAKIEADPESEVGLFFVGSSEMAQLNEKFLGHAGSTDVITFNYADTLPATRKTICQRLHGEIFICPDVAVAQSQMFRTDWREELARYIIHGILHLAGFDDLAPAARRKMKREESRLLSDVAATFNLSKLAGKS